MATATRAVVALTPREVVSRMSEIASEDEDYRRQLVDLAASRGGIYLHALGRLHALEVKQGDTERVEMDREQFSITRQKSIADATRRKQAELASSVASGFKSRAQARDEYRAWLAAQEAKNDGMVLVGVAGGEPARIPLEPDTSQPRKEKQMAKDTSKSGGSPLSARRGDADPTDVDPSEVQTDAGQFNYDANDRESLATDQWAAPGSGKPSAP
jgi:hypothetical protein